MFGTHVKEKGAIAVFISHAMVSDDTLPRLVVPSYSSIEVAKKQSTCRCVGLCRSLPSNFRRNIVCPHLGMSLLVRMLIYSGVIISGQSDAHRHKSFIYPFGWCIDVA